jgi:hypothetical protein
MLSTLLSADKSAGYDRAETYIAGESFSPPFSYQPAPWLGITFILLAAFNYFLCCVGIIALLNCRSFLFFSVFNCFFVGLGAAVREA